MARFFNSPKRTLLATLALGILALAGAAAWVALVRGGMERRIEALRASGQPALLADLAHKPIDPKDNAVTYLLSAKGDFEAIDSAVNTTEYVKLSLAEKDAFENNKPGPEMLAVIRTQWAVRPELFPRLEQAARCSGYDARQDYSVDTGSFIAASLVDIQSRRALARALHCRVLLQVADGQLDEGLHTCVIALGLIRNNGGDFNIHRLIDYACLGIAIFDVEHVLTAGPISAAARKDLDDELARLDSDLVAKFRQLLPAERAYGLQAYLEGAYVTGPILPKRILSWVRGEPSTYFGGYEQVIAAAKLPTWEWRMHIHAEPASEWESGLLPDPLPIIEVVHTTMLRQLAKLRALRVLNAIQQHEQTGDLAKPIDLTQLGLPADAIVDPFDGKPLRLKKLPDGWAVYSVGANLTDDGGLETEAINDGDLVVGQPVMPGSLEEAEESNPAEPPAQ